MSDEHLTIDATHFESRYAAKPSEKREPTSPKKRGRKSKKPCIPQIYHVRLVVDNRYKGLYS
ncbi:hypothetical protein J2B92_10035 [Lysinibacillus sphaericus]|uniref:hypothetical protein n=1 Tax=Lysinibacillus sphaericus TaxID=1421 RepID=UPI0018CEEE9F|nr:hypothetical protein [Lysinibacillus sphaericus]MBG9755944.1 hypothetical protein [Lysinibacillus sphaericus]QTB15489.1 hypothetical protein J2B92_10035 [Lysinibacillus sphaericus]